MCLVYTQSKSFVLIFFKLEVKGGKHAKEEGGKREDGQKSTRISKAEKLNAKVKGSVHADTVPAPRYVVLRYLRVLTAP